MQPRMISITVMVIVMCVCVSGASAGDLPKVTPFLYSTIADLGAKQGPRLETFMGNAGTADSWISGSALGETSSGVLGMEIEKTPMDFTAGTRFPENRENGPEMLPSNDPLPGSPFAGKAFSRDLLDRSRSGYHENAQWGSAVDPAHATWVGSWANTHGLGMIDAAETPGRDVLPEDDLFAPQGVELEGTHWRLVELYGEPVHAWKGRRVPYMEFSSEENQISGFAGCNQFFGDFSLEGNQLAFGPMGMTRMACPACSGGDLEEEFVTALGSTTNYTIQVGTLELYNGNELVARFEPAPFPR